MYDFLVRHMPFILPIAYKLFLVIGILLVCSSVAKIALTALENAITRIRTFDDTFLPVFKVITKYSIYGIGGLFILNIFGVNTTSLVALLGAAGLAVGLALKDTLSNIAAGLMLLILHPFKNGDYIETGNVNGTVREINLFVTLMDTPDGLRITVPNGSLWGAPIKNYSHNDKRRMEIVVGIGYGDSIETGLDVLRRIIAEDPRFLTDPAPQVMVRTLADSSVNLQMRAWTSTSDYWDTYWATNQKLKSAIEGAGLSIPFPQRDVHLYAVREK